MTFDPDRKALQMDTKPRIAPETDRTAYLRIDASSSPPAACRALLCYDPRDDTLWVSTRHQCENGVTFDEHYGIVRTWRLDPAINAVQFTDWINAGELGPQLTRIREGIDIVWDGSNHVAEPTDDAIEADDEIAEWLNLLEPADENAGVWDASDWLEDSHPADFGITEATTDDELDTIADRIEADSKADCVVLYGTSNRLRWWRDRLREEVTA